MGKCRTSSAGLKMPSSDVKSSKTSAQNARVKLSKSSRVQIFAAFVFRGSYFHVLVVGCENRENLDLANISRYQRVGRLSM